MHFISVTSNGKGLCSISMKKTQSEDSSSWNMHGKFCGRRYAHWLQVRAMYKLYSWTAETQLMIWAWSLVHACVAIMAAWLTTDSHKPCCYSCFLPWYKSAQFAAHSGSPHNDERIPKVMQLHVHTTWLAVESSFTVTVTDSMKLWTNFKVLTQLYPNLPKMHPPSLVPVPLQGI